MGNKIVKFLKMRQNDALLDVALNRVKRKSVYCIMLKKIKLNASKGEVNWAPDHIQGKDEASQSMHWQIMLEESFQYCLFYSLVYLIL